LYFANPLDSFFLGFGGANGGAAALIGLYGNIGIIGLNFFTFNHPLFMDSLQTSRML
jgi:hypothetical protein